MDSGDEDAWASFLSIFIPPATVRPSAERCLCFILVLTTSTKSYGKPLFCLGKMQRFIFFAVSHLRFQRTGPCPKIPPKNPTVLVLISTRVWSCTYIWESQFHCTLGQCRCKHRIITWVRDTPALVSSCIPVSSGFPILCYHLYDRGGTGTVFSDCHYQVCSDLFL